MPVADQRDPGAGLVGDGEQGAGGVLVEHPGLVDQEQVTGPQPGAGSGCGVGVGSSGRRRPSASRAGGSARRRSGRRRRSAPAATSAAFRVGVTTTSRRPAASSEVAGGRQGGGLAGPGRALDDHELAVAGQGADHRWPGSRSIRTGRARPADPTGWLAARRARRATRSRSTSSTCGEVSDRTCSGTSARSSSRTHRATARAVRSSASSIRTPASATRPAAAIRRLDLAADVGGVPRRPASPRAGVSPVSTAPSRSISPTRTAVDRSAAACWRRVAVAEVAQLLVPPRDQLGAVGGDDLVGPGLGPRPPVPRPPQRRPGLLAGMLAAPLGLVAVDVAARSASARALNAPTYGASSRDLAGLGVQGVARGRRAPPGTRVGHDRGVPDPVDRLDPVADPDRVQTPPPPGRPDPGVDLQVEVAVRVAGPGGVVPDHRRLDLLDRHLHLPAPRPHPGGRVLGEPADDLGRGPVLRGVVAPPRSPDAGPRPATRSSGR